MPVTVVIVAAVAGALLLGMVTLSWFFLRPMAKPLLSAAPDWPSWARSRGMQVREVGRSLHLVGELKEQHLELRVPDRGGLVGFEVQVQRPPFWVDGSEAGPLKVVGQELRCGPRVLAVERSVWAWTINGHCAADQLPGLTEDLAIGLAGLHAQAKGDLAGAHQRGFVAGRTRAEGRARALLAWTPRPSDPPPRPGALQTCLEREGAVLGLSERGWLMELRWEGPEFTLGVGEEGARTGNPVVDLSLGASGAPPDSLRDPATSEDTLWLLHGHAGRLDGQVLRVWLGLGELSEGLERGERLLAALSG